MAPVPPARRRIGLIGRGYVLTLNTLAGAGIGLVFWVVAARRFAPADLGFVAAMVSAAIVVSGIGTVGLNSALPRFIPRTDAWIVLVARGYAVAITVTAALGLATGVALGLVGDPFAPMGDLVWLVVFVASCVAWTVFSLQDFVLIAREQVVALTVVNAAVGVLRLAALFVAGTERDSLDLMLAWVVPTIVGALVVNGWLLVAHPGRATDVLRPLPGLRYVARYCRIAAIGTTASVILLSLMPLLVTALEGAEANARFYLPWSVAVGLQAVAAGMTAPLLPALSAKAEEDRAATLRMLRHTAAVVAGLGVPIVLGAPYALRALGSGYRVDSGLVGLLVAASLVASLIAVLLTRARAHNWLVQVVLVQWTVAVVFVVGAVALLPGLGLHGVGWAALGAQCIGLAIAFARQQLLHPLLESVRAVRRRRVGVARGPR